jgi:Ser/Thr protein kinase RdoA (MazF antagonist)
MFDNNNDDNNDVAAYMGLLRVLSAMRALNIVHGDIRMANVVWVRKGTMMMSTEATFSKDTSL